MWYPLIQSKKVNPSRGGDTKPRVYNLDSLVADEEGNQAVFL